MGSRRKNVQPLGRLRPENNTNWTGPACLNTRVCDTRGGPSGPLAYTRTMSPFRRLLPYVLRHRRDIVLGLLATLASTAIQLAGPWILKHAIDDLTRSVTSRKLFLYASLTLGAAVFGGIFRYLTRRLLIGASREMEYDLRNDFFAHLQRLSLGYYQSHRTGDLMSRATNDLNAVRMMIGPAVMYAASTGILFVVAIVLMLSINVKLTLVALLPLPFVSISVKYFGDAIHRRFE
jgi:ATP-binding cassette subfamily B multidrug efflux pump